MSIIVAVRVRPFNQREKDLKSKLCVKMKGNTTIIKKAGGGERKFTFDHSFWSHDKFNEEEDGYLRAKTEKYADQALVYDQVGKQVLNNALGGFHCCLFAYGQTGSGKSYSMIGYGANRGIVPIISEEIFKVAEERKSESLSFMIKFSMLEIYNEKVQDLMMNVNKRVKSGLKIRESRKIGVFVQGLSKHKVTTYEDIEEKMQMGNQNRTIASTQMNKSSSRAHTIISIELTQKEIIYGNVTEKFSVINLVDLAGSEKVSKTGATGDRLKEGSSINKSLTVLGMVISALADRSMGKKNKPVPYRTSALTRILQNALGGNSKTLMICAISPANDNYDETLSTLRYADQAKKIKCHAVINESPKDKMIRELKEENEKLRKQLQELQKMGLLPGGPQQQPVVNAESEAEKLEREALLEEKNKKEEEYKSVIEKLEEHLKSAEQKADQWKKQGEAKKFDVNAEKDEKDRYRRRSTVVNRNLGHAHLVNVNEDPFLTGKIFHDLHQLEKLTVGRKSKDPSQPQPNIILASLQIEYAHACVEKLDDEYVLYLNPGKKGGVYRNGKEVKNDEQVQLKHLDRIIFGTSAVFVFRNLTRAEVDLPKVKEEEIDYEYCQMELTENGDGAGALGIGGKEEDSFDLEEFKRIHREENERMMKEKVEQATLDFKQQINDLENETTMLKEKGEEAEKEREDQKSRLLEQYHLYIEQLERDLNQKDVLIDNERNKKLSGEAFKKMKEEDKKALNRKLAKLSPNITELNLIASELRRDIIFSPHLTYFFVDLQDLTHYQRKKKYRIKIKVDNKELGYTYFWDLEKFQNRYFMIKELLEKHFEDSQATGSLTNEEDPFFDYPQHISVGQGILKLMSLAYLLDNPIDLTIVGDAGQMGILFVNLIPVDKEGKQIEEDDEMFEDFVDDPTELMGHELNFIVHIGKAQFSKNDLIEPRVSYTLMVQDEKTGQLKEETFVSENGPSRTATFDYEHRRHHCFPNVTEQVLEYLLHTNLNFQVHAAPDIKKPKPVVKKKKTPKPVKKIPVKKQVSKTTQEIDAMNRRIRENIKKKKMEEQSGKKKGKKGKDGKRKSDCAIF